MWQNLAQAICLVLIIEGILPFLYPSRWRQLVASMALQSDRKLRVMGLVSMLIGVGLLLLVH
ncbi:DUF2065 domain-containing protein [Teredinibacter waterburyi]|jgi:Uncharacterized protein conserved in bacteria|uniref:DUF2065 domain-containing protein n=1 Tax=Teredinibacter waterburyi TaxID=1500538 RepID=UPI00165F8F90|nr:DUF2065 domain-containing protein [Teredinibacter waterburyi]